MEAPPLLDDLLGCWQYTSSLTKEDHTYNIRKNAEGDFIWGEGEVCGEITETKEHPSYQWSVALEGLEGKLWMKAVGTPPDLRLLVTLFETGDNNPIKETAALLTSEIVGTWVYTSSTTGTTHAYSILPSCGRLLWKESDLSGCLEHTQPEDNHPDFAFKVKIPNTTGVLWLKVVDSLQATRLHTLYKETEDSEGVLEVASRLLGAASFVAVGSSVQVWEAKQKKWISGTMTNRDAANGTYTILSTEGDELTNIDKDSMRVIDTKAIINHVRRKSETELNEKHNELLAESNQKVARIDKMDVLTTPQSTPPTDTLSPSATSILNKKPFYHLEKVYVKPVPEELEKLSASHGGWGGSLMAECSGKLGLVTKPTPNSDPLVMFGDGQVWRMNPQALARGDEMLRFARQKKDNTTANIKQEEESGEERTVRWGSSPPAECNKTQQNPVKGTTKQRREKSGMTRESRRRPRSLSPADTLIRKRFPAKQQQHQSSVSPNPFQRTASISPSRSNLSKTSSTAAFSRTPSALASVTAAARYPQIPKKHGTNATNTTTTNHHPRHQSATSSTAARKAKILGDLQKPIASNKTNFATGEQIDIYYGGEWLEAVVKRKRMDGNFDVEYKTGEVSYKVGAEFLRKVGGAVPRRIRLASASPPRALTSLKLESRSKSPLRTLPASRSRSRSPASSNSDHPVPAPGARSRFAPSIPLL